MKLLLKERNSNWDLYDNMRMAFAIAKEGTGCEDSIFGGYSYFVHYVRFNNLVSDLTEHGLKIYKENGGRL